MQLRRGLVPAQMVPEWLPDGWTGSFLNMAVFWNTCSHRAQQARLNLLPSAGAREIGRCSPLSCAGGLCAAPTGQSQPAVRAGPGRAEEGAVRPRAAGGRCGHSPLRGAGLPGERRCSRTVPCGGTGGTALPLALGHSRISLALLRLKYKRNLYPLSHSR